MALDTLEDQVQAMLTAVHDNLYAQAEKNLEDNTFDLNSWQEVKEMGGDQGAALPGPSGAASWSAS